MVRMLPLAALPSALERAAAHVSPAQCCQGVFVLLAAGVLAVNALPAGTRERLLDYGARETGAAADATPKKRTKPATGSLERVVAAVAARTQVPHAWFASFYAVYLLCAFAWAVQWWGWQPAEGKIGADTHNVLAWIATKQQQRETDGAEAGPAGGAPGDVVTLVQVYAACGLEALQAARRLYEHAAVLRPSQSKMNAAHWIMGLVFYVCMSVAVWVEGAGAIVATKQAAYSAFLPSVAPMHQTAVWAKVGLGALLFLLASLAQHRCHAHLASLKKYTLPDDRLFRYVVCPHYTCEILLYLSLSVVAAPTGHLFNRTLLSSVFFVVPCLGVTADRTKQWYMDRFGAEQVASKWKMLPFLF
ncbi:3-oxo-5-alpha-steroid 4-dehydrogenase [Niveomyces insectorum RCEF 264]|uniref:Polyprenal reductase n=1 Tax=Niveomyces insectorum RCEF 264 TaxID=1081102 RepID=A0A167QQM3_9HYPO|nr:3-oxo-5-alpha-steroid 4-dehydrogenase [Niveomyces insectorum RCEF 264]